MFKPLEDAPMPPDGFLEMLEKEPLEAAPMPPDGLLEMLEAEIKRIGAQVVQGVTCELKQFMDEQTRRSQLQAACNTSGLSSSGNLCRSGNSSAGMQPSGAPPELLLEVPGVIRRQISDQSTNTAGRRDPSRAAADAAERMGAKHKKVSAGQISENTADFSSEESSESSSDDDAGGLWANKRRKPAESAGTGISAILGKRAGRRSSVTQVELKGNWATKKRSSKKSSATPDSPSFISKDSGSPRRSKESLDLPAAEGFSAKTINGKQPVSDTSKGEQVVNDTSENENKFNAQRRRSSLGSLMSARVSLHNVVDEDIMETYATTKEQTQQERERIKRQGTVAAGLYRRSESAKQKYSARECFWYMMETYTDHVMGVVLVVNAIWMGIIVDVKVNSAGNAASVATIAEAVDWVFWFIFFAELCLRLALDPRRFFSFAEGWRWNLFDVSVITLQLADQSILLSVHGTASSNFFEGLSVLRMLRLGRLIRLVRMVRLFPQLKSMVYLIVASMPSFFWTAILLLMLLYIAAIYFTEIAHDMAQNVQSLEDQTAIESHWNSISKSMLTLYMAISGGGDWRDFVVVFLRQDSWGLHVLIFAAYVAFSTLVMLNLVTGVFVDGAQRIIRQEQDEEIGRMAEKMFARSDSHDEITWDAFVALEDAPAMSAYCAAVGITHDEAVGLFELLDTKGLRKLQISDFVKGSLRLRSTARTIDVAQLADHLQQSFTMLDKRTLATHKVVAKLWQNMQSFSIEEAPQSVGYMLPGHPQGHPETVATNSLF